MKETIGTTWLYSLVIIFILIFVTFLVLIINYSAVFRCKNDVTEIMEKYEGYTKKSRPIVDDYLNNSGYKTVGNCPSDYYGATSLDGKSGEFGAKKSFYCVRENNRKMDIILFYSFNLPMLGDLMNFNINGQSNVIKYLIFEF